MLCEIEFLAVGESSRAGDCIVARYGEIDDYKLMVVDGGTAETGESLVKHLRAQFGEDVQIEHVVLTHSDADHASGLRELIREMPVSNLWLHVPWLHAEETISQSLFKDKRWTAAGLTTAIKKEYDIIVEIVDVALEKGCQIYEPFQGNQIGPFTVLSPRRSSYVHLLPQFDKTPDPDQEVLEGKNFWLGKQQNALLKLIEKAVAKVQSWTTETWEKERLQDGGVTSASNESSVVLYGTFNDGQRYLLTGDAGINALSWAAAHAEANGLPLQNFSFVQIPHHGSRRNVGPTVLNRLLGPILQKGSEVKFSAFVSAPKDDEKHPRKIVLNAFMRRGGDVVITKGVHKVYRGGFPQRNGYGPAESAEFSTQVEEYD
jgi:beta-lactamase superfamily II metal-dependent hydrolase